MKKYIVIIAILVVYILVVLSGNLFLGNKTYLLITPKVRLTYNKGKWSSILSNKKTIGKLNFYDMNEHKTIVAYNVIYDGNIKVKYNKNYETIEDDTIYASSNNIKFIQYKKETVLTNSEQNYFLKGAKLNLEGIISLKKVVIDLDNDKELETIYFVNNYEFLDDELSNYYSGVYLYDNKTYEKIIAKSSTKGFTNFYNIFSIIDFKNDGKYEIIISDAGIDRSHASDEYYMYGLEDNKYIELISIK